MMTTSVREGPSSILPGIFPSRIVFECSEEAVIEIAAPVQWEYAQKYRQFQLRDVGPDWFQWNHYWANRFYLSKREWWQTFV